MKLFINSGVCERIWNGNVKTKQSPGKLQLRVSIPNYLEEEQRHENINFVFNIEGISKKSFERDLLFENISLRKQVRIPTVLIFQRKLQNDICMR